MDRVFASASCVGLVVIAACGGSGIDASSPWDPTDYDLASLSEVVDQVCTSDSGEYSFDSCVVEYQQDVLRYALQAKNGASCFDAFMSGLECEGRDGSGADETCYGAIDFAARCATNENEIRAPIPDDARSVLSHQCAWQTTCYGDSAEECLLRRYVESEVYRERSGDACLNLQIAFWNCLAEHPCRDASACQGVRLDEIAFCNYPTTTRK